MNLRSVHGPLCLAASAVLAALAGCASESTVRRYVPQIVTPYRIDIQQGNFVTQDMIDKLAVGQTRDQVRFIMGTPLVADMFHASRWDYVFRASKGWRDPEARRLVIHFDAEGRVVRWESEGAPPPREAVNAVPVAADKPAPAADASAATPEAAAPKAVPEAPSGAPPPASPGATTSETVPAAAAQVPVASTSAPAAAPSSSPVFAASAPAPVAAVPVAASAISSPPAQPARAEPATAAPTRVLAALESWRAAWSSRDIERYLSMYASDFRPPAGLTRARWEAQRRERIRKSSFIVVKLVDPQVSIAGDAAATAVFTQIFESDSIKESGRKTLALVQQGGDWKIRDERFEK